MQQPDKIYKQLPIHTCGFIPADQRRILQLAEQGLRPAAIAGNLRLRPGQSTLVRQFLALHGIVIPDRRLAS